MKRARMHVCFHCGLLETTPKRCRRCGSDKVDRCVPVELPTSPGWWLPLVGWLTVGVLLVLGGLITSVMNAAQRAFDYVLLISLPMTISGLACLRYGLRYGFEKTYRFDAKHNKHVKLFVYTLGSRILRTHVQRQERLSLRRPLSELNKTPARFISLARAQTAVWRINKQDVLEAWPRYRGPWTTQALNATRFNLFVGLARLVGMGKAQVWRCTTSELNWYQHDERARTRQLRADIHVVKLDFPPEQGFERVWWHCLPAALDSNVTLKDASELVAEHFDDVKGIASMNQREAVDLAERLALAYIEDEDGMLRDVEKELLRCRWMDAAA